MPKGLAGLGSMLKKWLTGNATTGKQTEVSIDEFKKILGKSTIFALAITLAIIFFTIISGMLLVAMFVPNAKGDFAAAFATGATISFILAAFLVNGITGFVLGTIDLAIAAVKWEKSRPLSAALLVFGAIGIYRAITYKPEMPNLLELAFTLLNLCTLIAIAIGVKDSKITSPKTRSLPP